LELFLTIVNAIQNKRKNSGSQSRITQYILEDIKQSRIAMQCQNRILYHEITHG
jgi:hypothetical protein